ncbi:DNA primase [Priestia endophytica]|uniref:DNA primase n=1 Tax=Priestia endophytica TaxID=135735 RepID=UPI00227F2FB8|nr:DNA primase [Priestia endophytica]MCY8233525.1 DNA primase [Priestia endophytica]
MGGKIPEEVIEQIRRSIDIVDVVGDHVQLKKQGKNYFGLCPFHGENTPSFSVSPDKQIYHCFGCGAGGNAFSFLMDIDGLSFTEAVTKLAGKVGIQVEQTNNSETKEQQPSNRMIEAHELLKKFYHHLLVNTKEGQEAYDYLLQRGFTDEFIKRFEIGYTINSWDFAVKFLTKRGFNLEEMEKCGLLIKKDDGNEYFDRFRNRIMFPIHDLQGRTIAFSGRILGEGQPKYLNSPETPIFLKSKTIYNFHAAKKAIRKQEQVLLFEGYADVIAAVGAECENSVATMGTSLTVEQAKIIRRNVESVIICYDGDGAGIEATVKAASILQEVGCHVQVAPLPDGYDPDQYIQEFGALKFRQSVIENSLTYTSFKLRYLKRGKDLQNEAERMHYIDSALKEVNTLTKAVEKEHYLRQLSDEFSISLSALKEQELQINKVQKQKKDNAQGNRNNIARKLYTQTQLLPSYQKAERFLLAYMLRDAIVSLRVQNAVQGKFNVDLHQALANHLYAFYEEGHEADLSVFVQYISDKELTRLVSELAMIPLQEELTEQVFNDYLFEILSKKSAHDEIQMKKQEQIEAERSKDYRKAAMIAKEILEMTKTLKKRSL